MALRVLGHPEDGARFRPVEVLHAHPASLTRGTRHDPCVCAPSSLNTHLLTSGPSSAGSRTVRTEGVGKQRENRPSPGGSGRPAHAPRPSEGYAAWSRPSHPPRTKGSPWPRTNSGARLRATGPVAMTTAGSAPGSRERRSKTDRSSPSFASRWRSVRPSRCLGRHRGAEPPTGSRRPLEGVPSRHVGYEHARNPRGSLGRRYGRDVPRRSEEGSSRERGGAGQRERRPRTGRARRVRDPEATLVEVLGMIASAGGILIGGIFLLGAILAGYAIWYIFIKK